MKKTLVASILGLAAVVNTFAQGSVLFNNYGGLETDAIVRHSAQSTSPANTPLNNTFTAGLYFAFGTVAWSPSFLTDPASAGFTLASATAVFNQPPSGPGYFDGGVATIPGYVSGPITFVVVAYNGANYASSLVRGTSAAFTLPSISTGLSAAGEFGAGFLPFTVSLVPEPSSFALAGLGLAGLLIFRRRK